MFAGDYKDKKLFGLVTAYDFLSVSAKLLEVRLKDILWGCKTVDYSSP